jgi:hypothetical protein
MRGVPDAQVSPALLMALCSGSFQNTRNGDHLGEQAAALYGDNRRRKTLHGGPIIVR